MKFGTDWNWVDLIILFLLVFGVFRGRKHGMSGELFPLLQIITTLIAGALLYKLVGDKLYDLSSGSIDHWLAYTIIYFCIIIVAQLVFSALRNGVGEKLTSGDLFGSMEYYFGMVAGALRYLGWAIVVLSILNAKAIDYTVIQRERKTQKENFGNISFPTYSTMQVDVLELSFCGKFSRSHLDKLLIEPTFPQGSRPKTKSASSEAQSALDDVVSGGKKK